RVSIAHEGPLRGRIALGRAEPASGEIRCDSPRGGVPMLRSVVVFVSLVPLAACGHPPVPECGEFEEGFVWTDADGDGFGTDDPTTDTRWYVDADADGFGDTDVYVDRCTAPAGAIIDGTDCDDARADVNPGIQEVCNGQDDDCDQLVDDADPSIDPATQSA